MSGKATASYVAFRLRREGFGRTKLLQALLSQGRIFHHGEGRSDILEVFSACSRHEDVAWSRGNAVWVSFFAFFMELSTARKGLSTGRSKQSPGLLALCVSVDSNKGPVDRSTQSRNLEFWKACACRQLWAGCRQCRPVGVRTSEYDTGVTYHARTLIKA
ncbi:hypothetical protein Taro_011456 [Colocasia esculenta]|uniref:Uncharacterized protein n=1 Tax=Colocasia esculenta TaxID=4460 RepID=A0A843U5X8_COLES|nr:hypothetical protein [Colocasia esculenta]